MGAFAFTLPILPGQDDVVRRIGESVSGELREEYEASRKSLGITEEKMWVQQTPIGQALVVYWETDDPQRTLREIADSQDRFMERFRELITSAAPALDWMGKEPLVSELLFSWQAS